MFSRIFEVKICTWNYNNLKYLTEKHLLNSTLPNEEADKYLAFCLKYKKIACLFSSKDDSQDKTVKMKDQQLISVFSQQKFGM